MNTRTHLITSALLAASLISGTAHAALEGRDLNGSIDSFEAYYDTDLNITWLANGGDLMNWVSAKTWAANLSFTDGVTIYADWRLPTTMMSDTSCMYHAGNYYSTGRGCAGSEMGHLFYVELDGIASISILEIADPDLVKFANLKGSYYWSETAYAPDPVGAYIFSFGTGTQAVTSAYVSSKLYVLAVSPGDVGAVPEADTWAMLLAGLGLVGVATGRRRS